MSDDNKKLISDLLDLAIQQSKFNLALLDCLSRVRLGQKISAEDYKKANDLSGEYIDALSQAVEHYVERSLK